MKSFLICVALCLNCGGTMLPNEPEDASPIQTKDVSVQDVVSEEPSHSQSDPPIVFHACPTKKGVCNSICAPLNDTMCSAYLPSKCIVGDLVYLCNEMVSPPAWIFTCQCLETDGWGCCEVHK